MTETKTGRRSGCEVGRNGHIPVHLLVQSSALNQYLFSRINIAVTANDAPAGASRLPLDCCNPAGIFSGYAGTSHGEFL